MSLLADAKKVRIRGFKEVEFSDEEKELAVAWARGEVTTSQCKEVLGVENATSKLLIVLKSTFK